MASRDQHPLLSSAGPPPPLPAALLLLCEERNRSQLRYSQYASKRSAIKRSATSATQLLFPIQIVTCKWEIAVSRSSNRKPLRLEAC